MVAIFVVREMPLSQLAMTIGKPPAQSMSGASGVTAMMMMAREAKLRMQLRVVMTACCLGGRAYRIDTEKDDESTDGHGDLTE
ncbi:MAG TPA: hypothetical protein VL492_03495 [Methylovirgula sp.]|nr:hypothetical protein [Methylovirgula sp.]